MTVGGVTSEIASTNPRVRTFPGAHNLRDLGGLRAAAGQMVRPDRIFRSDYPAFIDVDASTVVELGLRAVVDLRRGTEAGVECVNWSVHGVAYQRWPLTAGRESSWHARYPAYLTHRPETVVGAVLEVMRTSGHGVLFHCAAGKDRTGVVAALLLSVLGVSDADIVEDYVLSAASVEPVLARLVAMELYAEMLAGSEVADQLPRADYMASLLAGLADQGGAEGWLVGHGLPVEALDDFRAELLVG